MKYHFKITKKDGTTLNIYKIADDSQQAMRSLNNIPDVKSIEIVSVKETLKQEKCRKPIFYQDGKTVANTRKYTTIEFKDDNQ